MGHKVWMVDRPGGEFRAAESPLPKPEINQVLVRIAASGVNPLDTKIRAGKAALARQPLPAVLGLDMAGTVEAVGAGRTTTRRSSGRTRRIMTSVVSMRAAARKRSKAEATADRRSKVVVGVIGDARSVRNSDGQTACHPGIRNSSKTIETLGEVMIRIERPLVEGARTGTAEISRYAGRRNTEGVLPLLIPRESEVGLLAVRVLRASPPDVHQFFRIEIIVFDPAQVVTTLVRCTHA